MSQKQIKQIRRQAIKAAEKHDQRVLPELKAFINQQPLTDRIRCAWRILWGRF